MEKVCYAGIEIPLGTVWAAATDKGLMQVHALGTKEAFMSGLKKRVDAELIHEPGRFDELKRQLESWSEGKPLAFNLPLDLRGTEFQKEVWHAIHKIPHGKLSSYGRLAVAIGRPNAARAVGNAVGANPCGIVIPCHRVIWSNGGLGGFGGGYDKERLDVKRRFLVIEGVLPRVEGDPEKEVDLTRLFV
ncbi:MAG: methylated-DNA--[protein]-cysteine S-methyltransferase [Candidatus Bathyarchaeia archaeon]